MISPGVNRPGDIRRTQSGGRTRMHQHLMLAARQWPTWAPGGRAERFLASAVNGTLGARPRAEDAGIEPALVSPRLRFSKPPLYRPGHPPLVSQPPRLTCREPDCRHCLCRQWTSRLPEATVKFSRNQSHTRRWSFNHTVRGGTCRRYSSSIFEIFQVATARIAALVSLVVAGSTPT